MKKLGFILLMLLFKIEVDNRFGGILWRPYEGYEEF